MSIKILSEDDLGAFSVVESQVNHSGTDAFIRKITDGNAIYVLKQINDASIDEQFLLINDYIASTMGYEAGIHVNEVFFVPYNVSAQLKEYPERAATLHRFVTGKSLDLRLPIFLTTEFTLQQRVVNLNSAWQKKYPLAVDKQGLSKNLIESLGFHDDLAPIVALDTFAGNSDRSEPNIFYDQENKSFYGIDQAAAFSKKLPSLACDRLEELAVEEYFDDCSPTIIKSLCLYRDVLLQLYKNNSPSMVMDNMLKLIPYLSKKKLQNNEIIKRVSFHTHIMEQNYMDGLRLIRLLDQIEFHYVLAKK